MTVISLDELQKLPPLSESELSIINHARPLPAEDCPEMSKDGLKQFRPWYDRQKPTVTLDINIRILNYFKRLSNEIGVPYQE